MNPVMISRRRAPAALAMALTAVALLVTLALTGPAAARTARSSKPASLWQDKGGTVSCGITASAFSSRYVLCSGKGVPRPPHSNPNVGDPFVELASAGSPKLVLISQDTFPPGAKSITYLPGSIWTARGVSCNVEKTTVLCFNGANHGFRIGDGHYHSF